MEIHGLVKHRLPPVHWNTLTTMVWMKTFCFCCSVRLGVIVCAVVSIMHALIVSIILIISGLSILNSAKYFVIRGEQLSNDLFLWRMLDAFSKDPDTYMAIFQSVIVVHIIDSLMAVYGAVKLRKWFLVPYVVTQTFIAVAGMSQHVISMMILKKIVNLEMLIGYTLVGAFFMLFLGYSVTAAVSLFQIIILINSDEYNALYGDDPFAPRRCSESSRRVDKDLQIFFIPNAKGSDCVKEMIRKQRLGREVIPVQPVGKSDDFNDVNFNNWHLNEVVGVGRGLK